MKKFFAFFICLALILFGLTFRGNAGNPTAYQIEFEQQASGEAFETSQERSRYAIILSLVNYGSFAIDHYASMGTPDIGYIQGHYYSFFPPGASVLALPLFWLGSRFGIAQIAVFSISTIFSLATMCLMIVFARRLEIKPAYAVLAALCFGFATNAWGYSVTLYAHLISSFFILLGLYVVVFGEGWRKALLFWFVYSVAVFVDFPNLFIFLPMAVYEGFRAFQVDWNGKKTTLGIDWKYLITPIVFIVLMLGYAYYNQVHFGKMTTLSNTIPRVKDLKEVTQSVPEDSKDAVVALQTRNMLEGFQSFLVSRDRGVLIYSPIAFLFILGLGVLQAKQKRIEVLLVAVALTCLVLYTMFGDPYGGWAFGSRYVLAIMPELCLLAALGLNKRSTFGTKLLFSVVFLYSSAVSLLAPLTTNVIPPYVEARFIGLKYDYSVTFELFNVNKLNSFVYNHVLNKSISGWQYYTIVYAIIAISALVLIWFPFERGIAFKNTTQIVKIPRRKVKKEKRN